MTKARLIFLLVFAALLASSFAFLFRPGGVNDGGWIT
jgi:hypothetical protein